VTDWISRWERNRIGWHTDKVNSQLIEYLDELKLSSQEAIFVPLCGKSLDMNYLIQKNFKVIGVEISELAIQQFFEENNLSYTISKEEELKVYEGDRIKIYCGDFFDLQSKHLDNVKAVYDRASLIALDDELRQKYVKHLNDIINLDVRILLLTLNYPQHQRIGPPFAVSKFEVNQLFKSSFDCQELYCIDDSENEPMFQNLEVDFVEKAVHLLHKVRI